MAYLRDTAFVLSTVPFREQDAWVTLYGKAHGKLVGIVRGVRSSRSKQRGHIEPFSKIEVMIAKGQAFDKIAVAQTCASSYQLRSSLPGLAVFGSALAFVVRGTEQAVPNQQIFLLLDQLSELLSSEIAERISIERSALLFSSFILHFLDAEGYAMDFERCRVCAEALEKRDVWFSAEQGGVVCDGCYRKSSQHHQRGLSISATVLQTIRFLLREPFSSVLALTAPRSVLQEVSVAIDHMTSVLPRSTEEPVHRFLLSLA